MNNFAQFGWNDLLTVLAFFIALWTGVSQVRHYRAQIPDLSILEVLDAKYAEDPRRDEDGTRYDLKVKVENDGREPTTIVSGTLSIEDTDENLDLRRFEGSTQISTSLNGSPNLPKETDDRARISGKDTDQLKYRTVGVGRETNSGSVEGEIKLQTVGSDSATAPISFEPRFSKDED